MKYIIHKILNFFISSKFTPFSFLEEKRGIIPTHVGVNRTELVNGLAETYYPHACGGEPREN